MAKNKNESNNKNSGTLLTEKDGTQYVHNCRTARWTPGW